MVSSDSFWQCAQRFHNVPVDASRCKLTEAILLFSTVGPTSATVKTEDPFKTQHPFPAKDLPPMRPQEPDAADCCGEGCVRCIFDVHDKALERYAAALASWQKRQK